MRFILYFLTLGLMCASTHAALRLDDDDAFTIRLEGVPSDLAREFEVFYTIENGVATLPLIGKIPAKGLAPTELEFIISNRLREGKFFTRPVVSLNLPCITRFVFVVGAVRDPRRVQWARGITLTQALAAASGVGTGAEDKVRVKRRSGQILEFSRKAIRKNPSLDPKLEWSDVIEVSGEF
jgi:protein involved in polysaccharide export with SLBB domain